MSSQTDVYDAFKARFAPDFVAADTYKDSADIILFPHIPKTAGMSVGKALQASFDVFHPVAWENTSQSFRKKSKVALYNRTEERDMRQVLMGHFGWSDIMFWKNHELPIKCATIIRDPLARFASNYRYNCSTKHPRSAAFKQRFPNMIDYAHQLPRDYQLNMLIGAFYSFEDALAKLARYYSFIGATEVLGQSLQHFETSHGLPALPEYHENPGKAPADDGGDITDTVRNLVLGKSRNDARLHDLVQALFLGSA